MSATVISREVVTRNSLTVLSSYSQLTAVKVLNMFGYDYLDPWDTASGDINRDSFAPVSKRAYEALDNV